MTSSSPSPSTSSASSRSTASTFGSISGDRHLSHPESPSRASIAGPDVPARISGAGSPSSSAAASTLRHSRGSLRPTPPRKSGRQRSAPAPGRRSNETDLRSRVTVERHSDHGRDVSRGGRLVERTAANLASLRHVEDNDLRRCLVWLVELAAMATSFAERCRTRRRRRTFQDRAPSDTFKRRSIRLRGPRDRRRRSSTLRCPTEARGRRLHRCRRRQTARRSSSGSPAPE